MKFALLIMYEFRGVKSTIDGLYKNLIKPYNADIFICVQKALPDDECRMELFNENVVYREMYDKPDPYTYFGDNNNLDIGGDNDNFKFRSNLQIYINHHKMAKIIEQFYEEYDYFIIIRTDSQVLFPFPEKELFHSVQDSIYLIDANFCKFWGDVGYPGIIHKKYISDFLNCYYNVISNPEYKQPILDIIHNENLSHLSGEINQERFFYICLKLTKLINYIKKIKNINYYWTAETVNDYTTWSIPTFHNIKNVIYKYEYQCDEAYDNLELWNNGNYHWTVVDSNFQLSLHSTT